MTDAAIFLFDRTGNMAKPWAEAGILCYCVDLQHEKGERRDGNIVYVGADARFWRVPHCVRVVFVSCFPPCTHLAVSGARWFKGKGLRLLAESIELFAVSAELCEWSGAPYLIENPVSVVSSHWRKPDYTFHPWHYAGYLCDHEKENTTKQTCLWIGGGASSCPIKSRPRNRTETTCGLCRPATTAPMNAAGPRPDLRKPHFYRTRLSHFGLAHNKPDQP